MLHRQAGFTLIELLVTVVLLSLALVSLSSLFVSSVTSDTKARYLQLAADRVQREVERLRSVNFNSITATNTALFDPAKGYALVSADARQMGTLSFTDASLPGSTGQITIAYYDPGTGIYPSLKQITVTLSWSGARLARGSVTNVLLVANRPT